MTPELEKQIVSLIEAAKQSGSDAAAFIAQQAPDAIQQMLAWETAKAASCGLVALALVIFFLWGGRKLTKLKDDDYPPAAFSYALAGLIALFLVGFTMRVVKIQIAPKVVILETVADLARGK